MPRRYLLLAIAILFAGSLALVWWLTGDDGAGGARWARPGAGDLLVPAGDGPGGPAPPQPGMEASPAQPAPEAPPPPGASPSQVLGAPAWAPNAERRPPRGSPPPLDLFAGLSALKGQFAACAAGDARAVEGARAGPQGSAARPTTSASLILMLELEPRDGEVEVVGAPVQSAGLAKPETAACVQQVLVGQVLAVKAAQRGARIRMSFPVPF